MAETDKHMALVEKIKNIVLNRENIESAFLYVDTPNSLSNYPPNIGVRPDLYYNFENQLIIGEAKTKNDIMNDHTKGQLETYIAACSNYKGDSCLYFGVPWTEHSLANNLIVSLMKKMGVKIKYYIIDEMSEL